MLHFYADWDDKEKNKHKVFIGPNAGARKFAVKIEFIDKDGNVIDWHQFGSGIAEKEEVVDWLKKTWKRLVETQQKE